MRILLQERWRWNKQANRDWTQRFVRLHVDVLSFCKSRCRTGRLWEVFQEVRKGGKNARNEIV